MKITKTELLNSDYSTLFTRDPLTFFEAVLINVLWNKEGNVDQELINRQKLIFDKWFTFYAAALRHDIEDELEVAKAKTEADYDRGFVAGQLYALNYLPIKHGALFTTIDVKWINAKIKQLKSLGRSHDNSQA